MADMAGVTQIAQRLRDVVTLLLMSNMGRFAMMEMLKTTTSVTKIARLIIVVRWGIVVRLE